MLPRRTRDPHDPTIHPEWTAFFGRRRPPSSSTVATSTIRKHRRDRPLLAISAGLLIEERPECVDVVLKKVTDQDVGEQGLGIAMAADDPTEVEAIIESADELSHPVHASQVARAPRAQSSGRSVVGREASADRIGGKPAALEGQKDA